jgi:hypothetical protein
MFRILSQDAPKASQNFYRNVFALLTFLTFACALVSDSPAAFAAALAFGVLSRTAAQKNWKPPSFVGKILELLPTAKRPSKGA